MAEFRMPLLGADMEAGTLVEWLKHPGDALKRGDIIAVVDTAKGAIEIEVFEDGVLDSMCIKPGEQVPVGTVLAMIRGAGAPAVPTPPGPPGLPAPPGLPGPPGPAASGARARVSPIARRMAADLGVDLAHVTGSASQGAITRDDVERAAAALKAATPPAPGVVDRAAAMRAAIATAMVKSKRDIPHYYLSTTIDMAAALAWLRSTNEQRTMEQRLLPIALLIKAVALALRDVPELNGHWVEGTFRRGPGIHVGCAISLRGGGLIAPALHDADQKDVGTLMREMRDLVARARAGSLRSSELSDPTMTVTNLGDQGVDVAFGIIYPPQVALVGLGRIVERPWVAAGKVEPRPLLTATLSADHRASDGHRGGWFLATIDRLLQTPEKL
jgi:pyruvate dehydrogenase E2 component (dihydrolipoamide acetyltransferase)